MVAVLARSEADLGALPRADGWQKTESHAVGALDDD